MSLLARQYALPTCRHCFGVSSHILRARPQASSVQTKIEASRSFVRRQSVTTRIRQPLPGDMEKGFPAFFVRGGTSNGLVIQRQDLPPESEWHTMLPAAMGSPDPYGRQLDGMGSGISSTSKIIVLSPPSRPDVDVDYTFIQVGVKDGILDMAANCGNMSAAVGPLALNEGMLSNPQIENVNGDHMASVRIFNTNTSKVISSQFKVTSGVSSAENPPRYDPRGNYVMDGVPGQGSRITLKFLNPAGAKTGRALPTGNPQDHLVMEDGSSIWASLVDVSNPGVFIRAGDLGLDNRETTTPEFLDAEPSLKLRLESIRRAGAKTMGMDPETESVPKLVLLFKEASAASPDVDLYCQAMSMGQPHKAVPLTLALCLGASCYIPGTIGHSLVSAASQQRATCGGASSSIVIGHPSGRVEIGTTLDDQGQIASADLHRTARVLSAGKVFY